MSTELSETWRAYDALMSERKSDRRDASLKVFEEAANIARENGMKLRMNTSVHYQLSIGDGWLLNIYPGNRSLYSDRNRPGAPRLRDKLPEEWTLIDVVKAAIAARVPPTECPYCKGPHALQECPKVLENTARRDH